jgi:hypothetical protein
MTQNKIKDTTNKRPFGISLIAFLNIMKGMIGLAVLIYSSTFDEHTGDNFDIAFEYIERLLYLTIGIGLTLGKRWAWWIITYLFAISVFYNIYSLFIAKDILIEGGVSSGEITKYYYKLGASIIFQSILFIYLYQRNVFKFFKLDYSTIKKKLTTIIGFSIALIILIIVIELFI